MRSLARNQKQARRPALSGAEKVQGMPEPGRFRRAYARLLKRPEATMFHRCLALHLVIAASRSALD